MAALILFAHTHTSCVILQIFRCVHQFGGRSKGIVQFLRDVLSDPEGGFYASQDADVGPDDEGGYFTWTEKEFRRTLNTEEYEVLSLHLLDERGAMPQDPSRRVLFVSMDLPDITQRTGMDKQSVLSKIDSGRQKLLAQRNKREAPFVDRTFYTSLNGMLITSCLKASRILGDVSLKDFALKSLQRVLQLHFKDGELFHTEGVRAVLDDYIYLTEALIASYEVTGDISYLRQAEKCLTICIRDFRDEKRGGFYDTETEVIGLRLKGIEDMPHPSANAAGILLLLQLYSITGEQSYRTYAETALKGFLPTAKDSALHAAYYFCALDAFFSMVKLTIQAKPGSPLTQTVFSAFIPYLSVVYGDDEGAVIPCIDKVCYKPVTKPDDFRKFLLEVYSGKNSSL